MSSIESIISDLENSQSIPFDRSFGYAKFCSKLLRNSEMEDYGRKIVINILDNWDKLPSSTHEMWTDLIESSGFYPYLEKEDIQEALQYAAFLADEQITEFA